VGGSGWSWRRSLFAWEGESRFECCAIFDNVLLHINVPDKWI
jgi:hypothetical protein